MLKLISRDEVLEKIPNYEEGVGKHSTAKKGIRG